MGRHQRYGRIETLEKAMNLFWRSGFSGTSMRDLEDCLDMRPGSIYANFGNKEQLYLEAMELYATKFLTDFRSQMEKSATFIAGLRNFIEQLLFTPNTPCSCMVIKTLEDMHHDNCDLKEKANKITTHFENTLVTELKKARDLKEINPDCNIRSLARYIQVQIIGLRSYAEMNKPKNVMIGLLNDVIRAIEVKAGISAS